MDFKHYSIGTLFIHNLVIKTENYIYGWHFALKGLSDFKREQCSFPYSTPSKQCCAAGCFELPVRNSKHPNFEWRGVQIVLFS